MAHPRVRLVRQDRPGKGAAVASIRMHPGTATPIPKERITMSHGENTSPSRKRAARGPRAPARSFYAALCAVALSSA